MKIPRSVIYSAAAAGSFACAATGLLLFRQVPLAWLAGQVPAPIVDSATASPPAAAPTSSPTDVPSPPVKAAAAPGLDWTSDQRPAFDIVRIEATGDAVIAGHASPGTTVELWDGTLIIAKVSADGAGQFVILPPLLSSGDHQLHLASRAEDAAAAVLSDPVSIDVPASGTSSGGPSASSVPTRSIVGITQVLPTEAVKPPPERQVTSIAVDPRTAKVIRGDNLWRISQHYLGDGARFRQIYMANASQLRSPQLIYPGEVLVIPQRPPQKP